MKQKEDDTKKLARTGVAPLIMFVILMVSNPYVYIHIDQQFRVGFLNIEHKISMDIYKHRGRENLGRYHE